MNLSEIPLLSTAISILIAWALFSVLCSLVHEFISQLKGERGRFMKQYLFSQLRDIPNGLNWASLIYLQGNVDLLSRAPEKPSSELPAEELAKALISVVNSIHLIDLPTEENLNKTFSTESFGQQLDMLKPSDVVRFMKQAHADALFKNIDSESVKQSGVVYNTLVCNITKWFEIFDERLSLWYKKKTKERLFMLGAVIAFFVNVDSIQLFKYFNLNPQARTAIENYYTKQFQQDNGKVLSNLSTGKVDENTSITFVKQLDSLSNANNMQIGYEHNIVSHNFSQNAKFTDYLIKLLGILISGFAASMGAPFWFELLKNIYKKN